MSPLFYFSLGLLIGAGLGAVLLRRVRREVDELIDDREDLRNRVRDMYEPCRNINLLNADPHKTIYGLPDKKQVLS